MVEYRVSKNTNSSRSQGHLSGQLHNALLNMAIDGNGEIEEGNNFQSENMRIFIEGSLRRPQSIQNVRISLNQIHRLLTWCIHT